MTKLPVVSGKQTIKALRKFGFVIMRQKGSHVMLKKVTEEKTIKLTVPLHKELKKVHLRTFLRLLVYLLQIL
ncbi:MAG: type II toxin-antitoxin system HicA family toxin [Candidatus Asgardarchaeia archaeon]